MLEKGTCYTIGERVRLKSGGPEMLVVDMDPRRSHLVAAWKDGNAVSEGRFEISTLRHSYSTGTK